MMMMMKFVFGAGGAYSALQRSPRPSSWFMGDLILRGRGQEGSERKGKEKGGGGEGRWKQGNGRGTGGKVEPGPLFTSS